MEHILIIDRDTDSTELERDYLEINSYTVTIEASGVSGFQRALKEDIDLVITELNLDGLNGFELCRELRNRRDIPILIVSSRAGEIDKVRGLGVGADDYITKPFLPNELVARVKAHLSRYNRLKNKTEQKNDCIVYGQIRIDRTARRVTVCEEEIVFTTKEFDLLAFLAQHPGQVFSYAQLSEQVWRTPINQGLHNIQVCMARVRQKLDALAPGRQYIETIRRKGYCFRGKKG